MSQVLAEIPTDTPPQRTGALEGGSKDNRMAAPREQPPVAGEALRISAVGALLALSLCSPALC